MAEIQLLGMPSKFDISKPLNGTQRRFNELCAKGGGRGGGPTRGGVQELLRESGKLLNVGARKFICDQLSNLPHANPWHVCFAVGLSWGHLAQLNDKFIEAATNLLAHWNDDDLKVAKKFPLDRGPMVIEDSLLGGWQMFKQVRLPSSLPSTIREYHAAQNRWFNPILSNARPRYIGSWNACALFMVALFSNDMLSKQLLDTAVLLPPGGPIFKGLSILHTAQLLSQSPEGTELDDQAYEPGAVFLNNQLMAEMLKGLPNWNMTDIHSGLYMLGTRLAETDSWFSI